MSQCHNVTMLQCHNPDRKWGGQRQPHGAADHDQRLQNRLG